MSKILSILIIILSFGIVGCAFYFKNEKKIVITTNKIISILLVISSFGIVVCQFSVKNENKVVNVEKIKEEQQLTTSIAEKEIIKNWENQPYNQTIAKELENRGLGTSESIRASRVISVSTGSDKIKAIDSSTDGILIYLELENGENYQVEQSLGDSIYLDGTLIWEI